LHHAGIAALDGTHLRVVADLWERFLLSGLAMQVDNVDEKSAVVGGDVDPVDGDSGVGREVGWSV
jgi:hypothetical protein